MCSIFGAVGMDVDIGILARLRDKAGDRGRDGGRMETYKLRDGTMAALGNWRATPTPEHDKAPLQPYEKVVHNGTIANDKELGAREGEVDSMILRRTLDWSDLYAFMSSLLQLRGSYAMAGVSKDERSILLACNYKPIHIWSPNGLTFYFSSMARHFDSVAPWYQSPMLMPPYSVMELPSGDNQPLPRLSERNAIVIASAGLDSTTVAAKLAFDGYKVRLLHFLYGCKAESKEALYIPEIAGALGVEFDFVQLDYRQMSDSPLLKEGDAIAQGIEGAEYAHEWVPARNLVMLAMASAYAEANGFHTIALGNNLEESGAYPDNEEQMTCMMDEVLNYSVQNGYDLRLVSPVGHLMKHEIVRLGVDMGVPYHLTWSCYRAGEKHCGECGPCFMRKTAFERNGLEDPVFQEDQYGLSTGAKE